MYLLLALFIRPCILTWIEVTAIWNSGGICRESVLKQIRLSSGGLRAWLWATRTLLRYKLPGVCILWGLQRITASNRGSGIVSSNILQEFITKTFFLKRLCSRAFSFGLFKVYCLSIKLFQRVTWNEYCYCWFYFQRKFISIENRLIRSPYTLTHFVISPVSAYQSIIYKINLYVTKINSNKSFFWWWKCCIFIQNFENLVIHYAFIKRN